MVLSVPGTAEMKSDMIKFLMANSNQLFTNHVVHMLMVALTIFSGDDVDKSCAGSTLSLRGCYVLICPQTRPLHQFCDASLFFREWPD